MMDLRLASLNGRGLWSESRRSHLLLYLQRRGIDSNFHESILSRDYLSIPAYFDGRSRGITRLISRRLDATCALVLSDPVGRLCILDVIIKDKAFRQIGGYVPNVNSELPAFVQRTEPYVVPSKRVILVEIGTPSLISIETEGQLLWVLIPWMPDIFAILSNVLISLTNFAKGIQIR